MKASYFLKGILIWICSLIMVIGSMAQGEYETQITDPIEAFAFIDSTIQVFPSLRHDHSQEALELTLKANYLAKKYNSIAHLASTNYQLGVIYIDMGNNEQSFPFFENSLSYYQQLNDPKGICLNYKWLGHIYDERGDKNKGMDLLIKALNIARALGLTDDILKIQNNIGVILLNQGHHDEAIKHFNEILKIESDPYAKVAYMMNMAIAYKRKGSYDEAATICKKALTICEESDVESCTLWPRTFLLESYIANGQTVQALDEARIIAEEQRRLGLKKDELVTLNTIGMIFLNSGKYQDAIDYFQKTVAIAEEIEYPNIYMIYGNLSIAYEGIEDYKNSLDYLVKEATLKDSIFNSEKNHQIEDLLAKYEAEKREAEIERLKQEKELQQLQLEAQQSEIDRERLAKNLAAKEKQYELNRIKDAYDLQQIKLENVTIAREKKEQEYALLQNERLLQEATVQNQKAKIDEQDLVRNFLLVVGGIAIVASIIIALAYQQKIRNKNLLAQRTEEVNQQKILELIRTHEIQTIKASISGSETEKKRISSELHDGINGTLASIKMGLSKIVTETDNPKLAGIIEQLNDAYNDVRSLSHHLTPPRIKNTSFTHLISKYVYEVGQTNSFSIDLILFPEEELNELADNLKVEIYRIIQELLTNVVKHAHASQVEIQINKTPDIISVLAEDNGRGFDKNKVKEGIGLGNIESRVKILNGELDIDSRIGRGSIINIKIPVSA